jgi:hypothetical protein
VESFYQRLLANDPADATEQAELFLKDHSLLSYYDRVALRGLALAQFDAARGALDEARMQKIDKAAADLIDNLSEHDDTTPDVPPKSEADREGLDPEEEDPHLPDLPVLPAEALRPDWRDGTPVLCIAGRSALDRIGACMLTQLLGKHGLKAEVMPAETLTSAGIFQLDGAERRLVCLSYLDTSSAVHVRYAVRRLRRKLPRATIMVGAWGIDLKASEELCRVAKPDGCATTMRQAVELCIEAARQPQQSEAAADETREPVRLAG